MLTAKFVTERHNMGDSRSYEDWSKFLAVRPARLGIVARMNPNHTASFLTEGLMNVYYNDRQAKRYSSINAFMFEWEIDVDFVDKVEITGVQPLGNQMYEVSWIRRYYEKNDTFIIEGSRQHLIVLEQPRRGTGTEWKAQCQLIASDYASALDLNYAKAGALTRFMSNYHPEYDEQGYSKYQSNIERHRNYISLHRNDGAQSAMYSATEDIFISLSKSEGNGKSSEAVFKMNKHEKDVLDSFMLSRNNALLFGKCNYDKHGKCMVHDLATGRPIPMGRYFVAHLSLKAVA